MLSIENRVKPQHRAIKNAALYLSRSTIHQTGVTNNPAPVNEVLSTPQKHQFEENPASFGQAISIVAWRWRCIKHFVVLGVTARITKV